MRRKGWGDVESPSIGWCDYSIISIRNVTAPSPDTMLTSTLRTKLLIGECCIGVGKLRACSFSALGSAGKVRSLEGWSAGTPASTAC
jgi:hypothetical protein